MNVCWRGCRPAIARHPRSPFAVGSVVKAGLNSLRASKRVRTKSGAEVLPVVLKSYRVAAAVIVRFELPGLGKGAPCKRSNSIFSTVVGSVVG